MTNEPSDFDVSDPDIFSYGSLKFTYDLIRKKDAQLALSVRNIIGSEPLPKKESGNDNKRSDHFRVNLDSFQVRAVVESLMEQAQRALEGNNNLGMAIMANTLIDDWMALARKMIDELPDDQKPPLD